MKTTIRNTPPILPALCLCFGAWFGFISNTEAAVIYEFRQGVDSYTGNTSTFVNYQGVNNNYGGRTNVIVYTSGSGRDVAFMRFDLASIPDNLDVVSSTLTLTIQSTATRTSNVTWNLYPILRTGLNFGTVNGTTQAGTVSYSASAWDPTSPTGWGSSNTGTVGPVAGQDYSSTPLATYVLAPNTSARQTITINLDPATVEGWVADPSTNLGFVIVANVGGGDWAVIDSEEGSASFRPILSVTTVPEPSTVGLIFLGTTGAFLVAKRRKTTAQ